MGGMTGEGKGPATAGRGILLQSIRPSLLNRIGTDYFNNITIIYRTSGPQVQTPKCVQSITNCLMQGRRNNFYPRDAMLARVIEIETCLSVRPSVRPSRAGIVSKRRKLAA